MQFTAAQIALIVNGKVDGDVNKTVASFGKIEEATAGQLAFLANPKYEEYIYTTQASIIIVNESLQLKQPVGATLIRVADAYSAFAVLLAKYQEIKTQNLTGIQQPSYISPTAQLGKNIFVGAFAYIGDNVKISDNVKIYQSVVLGDNVEIGAGTVLHAGVKIYYNCIIGENVTIHAGTVIGSDGFGFAPQQDGDYKKVPQIGNVVVEDNVEIGANTTIDRATIGSTFIKKGVKLDNLVQIAHNVEVGTHTVIAAQSGISGSTKIGKNVMIGGQVGLVGHLHIGNESKINAQSGVTKSLKENAVITGSPAFEYGNALRSQAIFRNLPALENRVKMLEKLVQELTAKKSSSQ